MASAGRSPTSNTNSPSCKMAAGNHSSQKYTLWAERRSDSPSFQRKALRAGGEMSSTIIQRETERIKKERTLLTNANEGRFQLITLHLDSFWQQRQVHQRSYLGGLQSRWYNGWQQVSKFSSRIHINHGGWQQVELEAVKCCPGKPQNASTSFCHRGARLHGEVRACH